METGKYKLHRRAVITLQQLDAEERAHVREALARLFATPAGQWPESQARKLPGEPSLYLVRLDDSLRAFVNVVDGEEPEVQGFVAQETLDFFARSAANSAHGADR